MRKILIKVYSTAEEKEELKKRAEVYNMPLSQYMLSTTLDKKLPLTKTDRQIGAQLLDALTAIEKVNENPANAQLLESSKRLIKLAIDKIYELN